MWKWSVVQNSSVRRDWGQLEVWRPLPHEIDPVLTQQRLFEGATFGSSKMLSIHTRSLVSSSMRICSDGKSDFSPSRDFFTRDRAVWSTGARWGSFWNSDYCPNIFRSLCTFLFRGLALISDVKWLQLLQIQRLPGHHDRVEHDVVPSDGIDSG